MTAAPRLMSNHAPDQFQKCLVIHNKPPNTICVYRYMVKQFYYLYPRLTPRNLRLYRIYLLEYYRPQTVNLRIRALNCCIEHRQTSIIPVPMIRVQQKTHLDKAINQTDYEYLKRCLTGSEEYTYYFIVCLITAIEVCISKLITFQIEDVHTGHRGIYSKSNRMRRVYIPHGLVHELQEWLATTHRSTGPLSLNRFHSPISSSDIRARFEVFTTRYGLGLEVVCPRSFRRRFVKNSIEECGSISLLSNPLGHGSIEITHTYLWHSSSEQYRIVDRVMDWREARHEGT